jgi:undecaprenyl-phosphate galactose phosphotransferase
MLILGRKYKLTREDKENIIKKFETIHEIDIANTTKQNIVENIKSFIKKDKVKCIVLNLDKTLSKELEGYLEELDYNGVEFLTYSEFCSKYLNRCHIEFNDKNFKVLQDIKHNKSKQIAKRLFDIVFSIFAIILLSPIYLIVALLIKIKSPGAPVIFTQQRLGLNGKFFRVYKFRSMIPNAEKVLDEMLNNNPKVREEYLTYRKLKDDPRIIPGIGNIIRNYSIDELPQFFNVLFGDMSVVGPRPYIANEFVNHSQKYVKIITSVKPGVTGYWQVKERSNSTFNKRVEMDIEYIQNQTFWGDIKIIIQTVLVMVFKKGAY